MTKLNSRQSVQNYLAVIFTWHSLVGTSLGLLHFRHKWRRRINRATG